MADSPHTDYYRRVKLKDPEKSQKMRRNKKRPTTVNLPPLLIDMVDEIALHTRTSKMQTGALLILEGILHRLDNRKLYSSMLEGVELVEFLCRTEEDDFIEALESYYKKVEETDARAYNGPYFERSAQREEELATLKKLQKRRKYQAKKVSPRRLYVDTSTDATAKEYHDKYGELPPWMRNAAPAVPQD